MPINSKASTEAKNAKAVSLDPDIMALEGMSPLELDAWVEANITSFVEVRKVVKALLKKSFIQETKETLS